MDRNTVLWTITVFLGASLAFNAIRRATEGESLALALGLQVVALVVLIGAIVLFVRRRR